MSCATMTAPSTASRAHLDYFRSVVTLPSCDAARARAGRTGWRARERRAVRYTRSRGNGNWRARGIGFGIARGLVEAGGTVFMTARTAADCDAAATELSAAGNCVSLPCDLSNVAGIGQLAGDIGRRVSHLNILVNNAGVTWGEQLETYPEEQWDAVVDVNLKAPFFLVQHFLPLLRNAASPDNPARVINVGSIAAMIPMARNRSLRAQGPCRSCRARVADPAGLVGQGADIAGVAIFLASRAASYVTGAMIPVDGGLSLRNP